MTGEYARKTRQTSQNEADSGILQRSAVRSVPGKTKTTQVSYKAYGESSLKQSATQIPAIARDRSVVQPKLMLSSRWNWDSGEDESRGMQVQAKLAIAQPDESFSVPPIQTKLTIGQPDDKYEREADSVAKQVVKAIDAPDNTQSPQGQSVQRKSEELEEEIHPEITGIQGREELPEKLQRKLSIQGKDAIAAGEASSEFTSAINSARGGGQSLDAGLQESMGRAMGADFSGVQVHTDARSDRLNKSIQSKAFTTGQDVFFGKGEYQPGTRGGQEIIAHELTHVVQQNGLANRGNKGHTVEVGKEAHQEKRGRNGEIGEAGKAQLSREPGNQESLVTDRERSTIPRFKIKPGKRIQRAIVNINGYDEHFDTESEEQLKELAEEIDQSIDRDFIKDVIEALTPYEEAFSKVKSISSRLGGQGEGEDIQMKMALQSICERLQDKVKTETGELTPAEQGVWRFFDRPEWYQSRRYNDSLTTGQPVTDEELQEARENHKKQAYHMYQKTEDSLGVSFARSLAQIVNETTNKAGDQGLKKTIRGEKAARYLAYTVISNSQLVLPENVPVPTTEKTSEKSLKPGAKDRLNEARDRSIRETEALHIPGAGTAGKAEKPLIVFDNPFRYIDDRKANPEGIEITKAEDKILDSL